MFVRHIWRRMSTEMQSIQKWRRVSPRHWLVFMFKKCCVHIIKKEIRELKYLGQCRCLPGWKGDDCSVPCPANTWGIACAQRCTCLHNGTCRPNDGQCRCHDGWMGPQCNESKQIKQNINLSYLIEIFVSIDSLS